MTTTYEVIFARSGTHVVDSMGNACRYRTKSGKKLETGYYLVTWLQENGERLFDERALYRGPYASPDVVRQTIDQWVRQGVDAVPLLARDASPKNIAAMGSAFREVQARQPDTQVPQLSDATSNRSE